MHGSESASPGLKEAFKQWAQSSTTTVKDIDHFLRIVRSSCEGVVLHCYAYYAISGVVPYQHHFLVKATRYSGNQNCRVDIIHYAFNSDGKDRQKVRKLYFKFNQSGEFVGGDKAHFYGLKEGKWRFVENPNYPQTEEDCDDIWERAVARIGEDEYSLLVNNCETFVMSVMLDLPISVQVEAVKVGLGAAGVGSLVGGSCAASAGAPMLAAGSLGMGVLALGALGYLLVKEEEAKEQRRKKF